MTRVGWYCGPDVSSVICVIDAKAAKYWCIETEIMPCHWLSKSLASGLKVVSRLLGQVLRQLIAMPCSSDVMFQENRTDKYFSLCHIVLYCIVNCKQVTSPKYDNSIRNSSLSFLLDSTTLQCIQWVQFITCCYKYKYGLWSFPDALLCIVRYLALVAALAAEADYVFIPEWPPEQFWEERLCSKLESVSGFSWYTI